MEQAMEQTVQVPVTQKPVKKPVLALIEDYCPACGEPQIHGFISHDDDCPFRGDDLSPEEGNY
jgi:uncharacterized protein (DUF983 family)